MFQKSKTFKRCSAVAAVFGLSIISLVLATEAAKKRDFKGQAEFWFCKKGSSGKWEVFDKWIARDLTFKVSVTDIATGKEFTSNGVWQGESEKGHHISTRLSRPGSAEVSLADGSVRVVVPFEVTIDGKSLRESFTATSGTTEGPTGPISGQRAVFDAAAHVLKINVVGSKPVRVPAEIVDGTSNTLVAAEQKTILVVARLEGEFKKAAQ